VSAYFFDTSALVPKYIPGKFSHRLNLAFNGANRAFYICELTLIEMSSTLAQHYRKHGLTVAEFLRLRALFEDDIANGVLLVRTVTQADLMSARDLLEDAAVLNKRDLRSADAIIGAACRGLAYDLKRRVIFYTKDWTQYSSIRGIQSYRSALKLRYLGKGKGGIPSTTG
jgi:predicted nucleic acid-binding protein